MVSADASTSNKDDLQVTLLKNRETNRIELVQLQDAASETLWLVQSYNLRYSKELDTLVPMKIDVFDIRDGIASKKLIIQFDYKSILKNQVQGIPAEKIMPEIEYAIRRTLSMRISVYTVDYGKDGRVENHHIEVVIRPFFTDTPQFVP